MIQEKPPIANKGYVHVEIESVQTSKKVGAPCGDVLAYDRTPASTTLVVSDGLGSGIKAHVAAQMCVSRMLESLKQGCSLRKAFSNIVNTMNEAKEKDLPYAVFTVVRVLNDGVATILSYEMPAPVFVTSKYAQVLKQRVVTLDNSIIGEVNCHVAPGEGILVVSDGVSQAGLGRGLANGWTIDGVGQYINDCLSSGAPMKSVPKCVLSQARKLWSTGNGDDITAVLARCRWGKIVNILTGPPTNRAKDGVTVKDFMLREGTKIVSGGTTSKIVADALGTEVSVEYDPYSTLTPARYGIKGVDLVTEGAVTLNQVYNILDENPDSFNEVNGVTELQSQLLSADRVNIIMGQAINPANRDISFRQKGILTRQVIIPLIADKLRAAGKLVTLETV
jgi:hypothetical protein